MSLKPGDVLTPQRSDALAKTWKELPKYGGRFDDVYKGAAMYLDLHIRMVPAIDATPDGWLIIKARVLEEYGREGSGMMRRVTRHIVWKTTPFRVHQELWGGSSSRIEATAATAAAKASPAAATKASPAAKAPAALGANVGPKQASQPRAGVVIAIGLGAAAAAALVVRRGS